MMSSFHIVAQPFSEELYGLDGFFEGLGFNAM
jgi:hypothetical protein